MSHFEGRTWLVVGASSGIGLATATRIAAEGGRVVAVARDAGRLGDAVAGLAGRGHHAHSADAADDKALDPVLALGKALGGFSGAACCAGQLVPRPISLLDPASSAASYAANVAPALNVARVIGKAVAPGGASVVWLSSVAAHRATAGFGAYSAAKGALLSLARVAATELAGKKIRVNVVTAGVVPGTPIAQSWMRLLSDDQRAAVEKSHLLGLGRPEDVASAILFLLSEDARWVTGSELVVDGGLSAR